MSDPQLDPFPSLVIAWREEWRAGLAGHHGEINGRVLPPPRSDG